MRNVTLAMQATYLQWLGSWCCLGGVRLPRGSGSRGPPCQEADMRAGRPLKCSRARIPSYTCVKETFMSCLVTTLHALMFVFVPLLQETRCCSCCSWWYYLFSCVLVCFCVCTKTEWNIDWFLLCCCCFIYFLLCILLYWLMLMF